MLEKFLLSRSIVFITRLPGIEAVPIGTAINLDMKMSPANYIDDYTLVEAEISDENWSRSERPYKDPLTTRIKYKNGISLSAEVNRVVFQNSAEVVSVKDFEERAVKLFQFILSKEIAIGSVGINFSFVVPMENPGKYITEHIVRNGLFNDISRSIKSGNLKVSYEMEPGHSLNLQVFSANKSNVENYNYSPETCIVYDANFHVDGNIANDDEVIKAIKESDAKRQLILNNISI